MLRPAHYSFYRFYSLERAKEKLIPLFFLLSLQHHPQVSRVGLLFSPGMKSGKGSHDLPPVKCLPPPLLARAPPVVPWGLSWQSHFLTPCGALQTFHSGNSGQRLPMLFSKRFFRSCQSDELVPVAFAATPTQMLAAFP